MMLLTYFYYWKQKKIMVTQWRSKNLKQYEPIKLDFSINRAWWMPYVFAFTTKLSQSYCLGGLSLPSLFYPSRRQLHSRWWDRQPGLVHKVVVSCVEDITWLPFILWDTKFWWYLLESFPCKLLKLMLLEK